MRKLILFYFFYFLASSMLFSQGQLSTKSKKAIEYYFSADNFRVRGQLDQAVKLLNQAIAKDSKFEEAYYRLGLTLRSSNSLSEACHNFEKGLSLTTDIVKKKNYTYILGECYLRQGKYDQSLTFLNRFLTDEKFDKVKLEQSKVWKTQCEYSIENKNQNFDYQIKPLSDTVNIYPMQYFPTLTADGQELIFTIRFGGAHDDNEDIIVSRKDINGRWNKPVPLSDQINSNYREGASTISADGRKLIFTICGPRGCDLFESNKNGDKWSLPKSLGSGVNTSGWEAQPALSADGNELYFVSDRRGGFGGYDIWYSTKTPEGVWGKAINIGKSVNTPFDEIAPFVHVNNQNLYFASNGLPGFGSYDIYVSEKVNGQWNAAKNMGFPLNNFEDQYSFAVTSDGKFAYYSKEEAKDRSKIYFTPIPESFQIRRKGNVVKGRVLDAATGNPLKAMIQLKELNGDQVRSSIISDSVTGNYLLVVPGKSEYALFADKAGYLFNSINFDYQQSDLDKPLERDIHLQPITKGASVSLNNIFFDLNSYELLEKSKSELNEVILFLQNNPFVKIEIGGHTDDLGNEAYNLQLSLNRAKSVGVFLKNAGISVERIKEVGYASKKPLKPNNSDQNRQLNRRIEFKIQN